MKSANDKETPYHVSLKTEVYSPWLVYYIPHADEFVLIKFHELGFYSLYHPKESQRFGAEEEIDSTKVVLIGEFE